MEIKRLKAEYMEANVFVIIENDNALIIDSGAKLKDIKKAVKNRKVLATLLTHGHFDHAYYADAYAKEFGCPIYIHNNGKATLSSPESNYAEDGFVINDFSNFKFLEDSGELNLPPFKVKYFSTKGHSNCSICYQIGEDLFAGDTLFSNGIGRTDLVGSSKDEMIKSLDKLSSLTFATTHSGHGEDSDFARQKRNIALFKRFLTR